MHFCPLYFFWGGRQRACSNILHKSVPGKVLCKELITISKKMHVLSSVCSDLKIDNESCSKGHILFIKLS